MCFLSDTDFGDYCRDVSGGMASIRHICTCDSDLHMVSGENFSNFYAGRFQFL